MNKKIILLPFLMAGLLIGCNPSRGGSSSQQQSSGSQTSQSSEGSSGGQSQSTSEKAIWEEDLVSGESTIAQVKTGTPGEYYKVRGTVVWNSGSTLALARNGEFLYCYNFNGDSATTGNEDLKAHPLGSYVEIYGQSSEYSGSIQLTAYVNKAYDPDAKLTVLADQGEPVQPVEVKTAEAFANGPAAGMLAKVLYTADKDYELAANTAANTDFGGAIEGLSEDAVSTPIMRMEKYLPADIQTALIANNPAFEEGSVYEVVGLLAATSKGSARVMLGEGSSWALKTAKVWDEPTGVTITAAGDATEVEVDSSLQLTAVVAPAGAKQKVEWAVTTGAEFATIDQTGKVTGVAVGDIVVTATAKEGVAGTLNLHVKAAAVQYESIGALSFAQNDQVAITNELDDGTDPKITYAENGVTIVVRKNTSSSDVNVWKASYSSCRWYVGHSVTISSETAFKRIVLTCDDGYAIFKDGATGEVEAAGGATVSYDGLNIILELSAAANSLTIVPDKQLRPNAVELFKVK